jgi:broad specificity phosphatase PhoE
LRYGRNAPLENLEQNKQALEKVVDEIIGRINASGKEAVLFVISPRIRAEETAHLVGEEIKRRIGSRVKIRYSVNDDLKSTEEGEFILSEDYEPGSHFGGLEIASRIFIEESLGPSKNMHYRYGDPVAQPDGTYRHPELAKYFKASGETYAEALTRVFSSVVRMSKKVEKLKSSVEVVLISHGFTFHILRGLAALGEQIKNGKVNISEGEIAEKLYEIYKNDTTDFKSLAYVPLDITNLGDENLMTLLTKEIEHLKE